MSQTELVFYGTPETPVFQQELFEPVPTKNQAANFFTCKLLQETFLLFEQIRRDATTKYRLFNSQRLHDFKTALLATFRQKQKYVTALITQIVSQTPTNATATQLEAIRDAFASLLLDLPVSTNLPLFYIWFASYATIPFSKLQQMPGKNLHY